MAAFCVVEHFDVIKHITASILSRGVDLPLDPFPFQKLEKALGHGVVMTVASATHAGNQIVCLQKAAPIGAAVLAALVGMNHHLLLRFTPPNRHQQCINSLITGHLRLH